jgi:WD40 repeat protein
MYHDAAHSGDISAVAFNGDGLLLASASLDKSVILWRSSDLTQMNVFNYPTKVCNVRFHQEGQNLLVCGKMVTMIDYNDGHAVVQYAAQHSKRAYGLDIWMPSPGYTPTEEGI